jgi:uncharacterized protein with NRDE domain
MCLIVVAWQASPAARLAVAANRDEFFARRERPRPRGGRTRRTSSRDGTFRRGDVARRHADGALRGPHELPGSLCVPKKDAATSRGALVAEFLRGEETPRRFLSRIRGRASSFEGFNLLVSDDDELWSFSNVEGDPVLVAPGVYGLSNHLLETPWPKVVTARELLAVAVATARSPRELEDGLLFLLRNRTVAPDGALPETGLPLEWERALSAAFVVLPDYGTRASTTFVRSPEARPFRRSGASAAGGALLGEVRETFRLSATPRA